MIDRPTELTLVIHKVADRRWPDPSCISPGKLNRFLDYLSHAGLLENTRITFDDGYDHLRDILPPIIEKYSLKPTIFVPTAWIGRENVWDYSHRWRPYRHLSAEGIRELAALGVQFGSHGHTHAALDRLTTKQCHTELEVSRNILEDLVGEKVDSISYPFGRYTRRTLEVAREVGFTYGFGPMSSAARHAALDTMTIPRYPIYPWDTKLSLRLKLGHGPLAVIERWKARCVGRLAGGTVLWQRLKGSGKVG